MKAFLGTGLLGAAFTRALISKGDKVQVWNRTYEKAKELEQYGATAFEHPADAVRNADMVHIALKDDTTVEDALSKAEEGLKKGAIIVDHTTTSVDGARKRTKEWREKGFSYQHAPVFMGPANALQSTGYMLVSGDQDLVKKLEPHLTKMTGKLINFGDEAGKAAAMKLTGNCFLIAFTAGLADTLSFAGSIGVSVNDINNLFGEWNPAGSLGGRLKRLTSDDFSEASWRLDMARKDTGLFISEAAKKGTRLRVIPEVAAWMDEWIAKGHGQDDWMIIGKTGK
ncbi:MAG TPA: NAD(P)-dependent oxidoreductase [Chitinophagaceae bacterium]|nr:NAD(P)-dependent oxidoreductase [Chitinophagaceae bacterium]